MKILSGKNTVYLIIPIFLIIFPFLSSSSNRKYERLFEFIKNTQLIDVHSHPIAGHVEYKTKDPYPTLEPPIGRPFWPIKKERIAVFDSMQVEALKEIYGYKREDVTEKDLPDLKKLSQEFWEKGKKKQYLSQRKS